MIFRMVLKYLDGSFFRFVTTDAFVKHIQTDGQTDKQTDAFLHAAL